MKAVNAAYLKRAKTVEKYAFPAPVDLRSAYTTIPTEPDMVLPGFRPGTIGSIVSPGGTGKSMLGLMLAHWIATGKDLLQIGDPSKQFSTGNVVYLSAEDDDLVLRERLFAIGEKLSDSEREIAAESITLIDMTKEFPDILNPMFYDALSQIMSGRRCIFIDTLRTFHSDDEQDNNAMSALVNKLKYLAAITGCSIIFIHHTSKAAALNGQIDMQQASRGAAVLTDNPRWQGYLAGMTKDEAKTFAILPEERWRYVRFGISKQNYGPPLPEAWYKRETGGRLQRIVGLAAGGGVFETGDWQTFIPASSQDPFRIIGGAKRKREVMA